jgi:hypothetical protein
LRPGFSSRAAAAEAVASVNRHPGKAVRAARPTRPALKAASLEEKSAEAAGCPALSRRVAKPACRTRDVNQAANSVPLPGSWDSAAKAAQAVSAEGEAAAAAESSVAEEVAPVGPRASQTAVVVAAAAAPRACRRVP